MKTIEQLADTILNIVINAGTEKGTARLGVENVLRDAIANPPDVKDGVRAIADPNTADGWWKALINDNAYEKFGLSFSNFNYEEGILLLDRILASASKKAKP